MRPTFDLRFMLAVQLYGPFLRSMVKCATKTQPGLFTGSAHCGDANLVPFLHNFRLNTVDSALMLFPKSRLGKDIDLYGTRMPDQCLICIMCSCRLQCACR